MSSSHKKKLKGYFGNLSPHKIESMNLFPAYPKSHSDGYAIRASRAGASEVPRYGARGLGGSAFDWRPRLPSLCVDARLDRARQHEDVGDAGIRSPPHDRCEL